jgi:hypothetical protein
VKALGEELPDATSGQLHGRLRALRHHKLVLAVVVQPVSWGKGWQRTQKGKEVLSERREYQHLRVIDGEGGHVSEA